MFSLFPSIFPFLLITKLIIYYNILDNFNNIFSKYLVKIFNVSKYSSYIIIISMFTGFPTSAIYINELLNCNKISVSEANKLITFTCFANPIFIISFIGENLLNNRNLGILIYIIHIISGLAIAFIFKSNIKNNIYVNNNINRYSFSTTLIKSINESFITLINMLGIIIFFLIIISIIDTFFINNLISFILKCILELTTGVIFIAKSKINIKLKTAIIGAILSFNGLSVQFQIKSIIDNSPISFKKYFIARIIHSLLCFLIIFITLSL